MDNQRQHRGMKESSAGRGGKGRKQVSKSVKAVKKLEPVGKEEGTKAKEQKLHPL